MHLLINVAGNLGGGGLQVALSFISECKFFADNDYSVFLGVNALKHIQKEDYPSNFTFYDIPYLRFYQFNTYLRNLESRIRPDVVFSIFGPSYFCPTSVHLVGYAQPYYIYNQSPFWKQLNFKQRFLIKMKKIIHLSYFKREADAFVTETCDATNRIKLIFGTSKKYYTVSNTCSCFFVNKFISKHKLPEKKVGDFRLLTLSKLYLHKNIHLIPEIVDILLSRNIDNIKFVLTISTQEYDIVFKNKYLDNVITVGPISMQDCPSLYEECDAMFLPTTMECFSASYPESMIMGKPILTSDLGFAFSVCDDAALYFNPTSVTDIVDKIVLLANDKNLQLDLVGRGYKRIKVFPSSRERARQYLEICKSLIKK